MDAKLRKEFARIATSVKFVALALTLFGTGCSMQIEHEARADPAEERPQVTVAQVTEDTIIEYSEHTGHTESPGSVDIRARATGYLTRAAFREGDLVKQGDLLFEVDPKPYQAALKRAKAELVSARVNAELAGKNAVRAEQLFRGNAIAAQEWDTSNFTFQQLEARTQVASAALTSAELDLQYAYVRSPIAGRVGRFLVTPGNLVGPSLPSPLTTVVSVDPLYVYIDIDETRALRLGRAPNATIRVGFSDEEGFPHDATLDFVDNGVAAETGTLKVRAVLRNPDGRWVQGLFARVQLPEGSAHEAVLIADQAVATDQDRRFVWVVAADGKVEHRMIKPGPLNGGLRIVREGLTTSDRIVVRGLQRVRPGVLVAAQTISMREAAQLDKLAEAP